MIQSSRLAIVCSGTATLECALLGTPMVICNRASLLTYWVVKSVIKVPFLGLPNLVLGKKVFPELLQHDATPQKIAKTALAMLSERSLRESLKGDLKKVSEKLGDKKASLRAAEEILKELAGTSAVHSH